MSEPLLAIRGLETTFYTRQGVIKAVDNVSLTLNQNETLGIVGESGSGKSVSALSIMQLLPEATSRITRGEILYQNENLLLKNKKEMRRIRGNEISMIFQEPMTSLNPVYTIGNQIGEVIRLHQKKTRKQANIASVEILERVGISNPERRIHEYPHQLSGGMRQRVMIAIALSCKPKILIADEPTTALDVTIQAQILDLLNDLKNDLGTAIMFITHDLGIIAEITDRVVVMYAGHVLEHASVFNIFKRPLHPYTRGLLSSIPKLSDNYNRLFTIDGVVPNIHNLPSGCRFHPRCRYAEQVCRETVPELTEIFKDHSVRCWLSDKINNISDDRSKINEEITDSRNK